MEPTEFEKALDFTYSPSRIESILECIKENMGTPDLKYYPFMTNIGYRFTKSEYYASLQEVHRSSIYYTFDDQGKCVLCSPGFHFLTSFWASLMFIKKAREVNFFFS